MASPDLMGSEVVPESLAGEDQVALMECQGSRAQEGRRDHRVAQGNQATEGQMGSPAQWAHLEIQVSYMKVGIVKFVKKITVV